MSVSGNSSRNSNGLGMTSQRARDRLVERLRADGINDPRVLDAIKTVPRHLYIGEGLESRAYEDSALPIGLGQTISQPFVVARMTEAILQDRLPKKVLEIGTGSGYQAAVLSGLVEKIFTVERIAKLYRQARLVFHQQNLNNIRSRHDDGRAGWPEEAPFDAILVTAAGEYIDPALIEQLAVGGTLVAPIGPPAKQNLIQIKKTEKGLQETDLGAVSFVPLLKGTD